METNNSFNRASKKLEDIKSLYHHVFVYIMVNVLMLVCYISGFGLADVFWETSLFVTAVFGGMGVAGHWAATVGYRLIFSHKKEQQLLEETIKRELQTN